MTLRDKRMRMHIDADAADDVRVELARERQKPHPDPVRVALLEKRYHVLQNRADASWDDAHRFDDERD